MILFSSTKLVVGELPRKHPLAITYANKLKILYERVLQWEVKCVGVYWFHCWPYR